MTATVDNEDKAPISGTFYGFAKYIYYPSLKHQLMIPLEGNAYVEGLRNEVKIIRVGSDITWTCFIEHEQDDDSQIHKILSAGWSNVAEENNIELHDTLTFVYLGNSDFNLTIARKVIHKTRKLEILDHTRRGRDRPPHLDTASHAALAAKVFLQLPPQQPLHGEAETRLQKNLFDVHSARNAYAMIKCTSTCCED